MVLEKFISIIGFSHIPNSDHRFFIFSKKKSLWLHFHFIWLVFSFLSFPCLFPNVFFDGVRVLDLQRPKWRSCIHIRYRKWQHAQSEANRVTRRNFLRAQKMCANFITPHQFYYSFHGIVVYLENVSKVRKAFLSRWWSTELFHYLRKYNQLKISWNRPTHTHRTAVLT